MTLPAQPPMTEPIPEPVLENPAELFADPIPNPQPARSGGGVWTIALLCIGLSMIAACVLIPQADANRRLVFQRQKLLLDLDQIQRQASVNRDFLHRMEGDPQLAERLVQRQLKMVREGETVLDVQPTESSGTSAAAQMSPFEILAVPAAAALQPYQPLGGSLAEICRKIESQLWVMGVGLFLVAAGLILGDSKKAQPLA